ncbi:glutathione S-transferase family protein [Paracoccus pacificus]|uniref:Glutathione S-transferase family protein n=1 Tax=Paracoccus pacificus TaxID=1463598 RepID=A0ABW4RB27_9RHOB
MSPLTIVTLDWVPDFPRGFVRDIRARWAAEEAGRPYQVETVPGAQKTEAHREIQPYQQVPAIRDGDLTLFESGAIVLHLAEGTPLLPPDRRSEVTQWVISALNTVEIATGHWLLMILQRDYPEIFGPGATDAQLAHARRGMDLRLGQLERELDGREWLLGDQFTAGDILMADTLRQIDHDGVLDGFPGLRAYLDRAKARPGFQRAYDAQMDHWKAADKARAAVAAS